MSIFRGVQRASDVFNKSATVSSKRLGIGTLQNGGGDALVLKGGETASVDGLRYGRGDGFSWSASMPVHLPVPF